MESSEPIHEVSNGNSTTYGSVVASSSDGGRISDNRVDNNSSTTRGTRMTPVQKLRSEFSLRTLPETKSASHRRWKSSFTGRETTKDDATSLTTVSTHQRAASTPVLPNLNSITEVYEASNHYNWRDYAPDKICQNPLRFFRWFVVGGMAHAPEQSDEERRESLAALARCIVLLRLYSSLYDDHGDGDDGIDDKNHAATNDQKAFEENHSYAIHKILQAITSNLYAGGAPLWAMEGILKRVCQGLLGTVDNEWILLPRKAITSIQPLQGPSISYVFSCVRGYNVSLLDNIEPVTTRLASFASNSESVSGIPISPPTIDELNRSVPTEDEISYIESQLKTDESVAVQDEVRTLILDLTSQYDGIFNFVNTKEYTAVKDRDKSTKKTDEEGGVDGGTVDEFWIITRRERELFSRLATDEASKMMSEVQAENAKLLYPSWAFLVFEIIACSAACLIWFGGSWWDALATGILAGAITQIRLSSVLSKQEKLLYEVVASYLVGTVAGLVVVRWPKEACFGAISVSALLNIFQGFRIVLAAVQVMSKNSVAGAADLIEGLVFTGLIAISLRFGLNTALRIMRVEYNESETYGRCESPINQLWFFLIVPLASFAWSGSFNPRYNDLFGMACHGTLAFSVNYVLDRFGASTNMNLLIASLVVSFSAGFVSRFTSRQAVANTLAGIYVLVPGAYLTQGFLDGEAQSAFVEVGVRAIVIGLGTWTGSILCSPMVLGTTTGLIYQSQEMLSGRSSSSSSIFSSSEYGNGKKDPLRTTMLKF